jgi:hypothetical protein
MDVYCATKRPSLSIWSSMYSSRFWIDAEEYEYVQRNDG